MYVLDYHKNYKVNIKWDIDIQFLSNMKIKFAITIMENSCTWKQFILLTIYTLVTENFFIVK